MKKSLFILLTIFSLFFITDRVSAESLGEKFTNFTVSGFEFIFGDGFTGVKDFAEYNPNLAMFDGLENNIPPCDNSYSKYCDDGTIPNIRTLIEDFPYLVRFKVIDNSTNNFYYIFGFYENKEDILGYQCWGDASTCFPIIDSPNFTISMLPNNEMDSSFYSALHSSPYVLGSFHPSNPNSNLTYVPFATSRATNGAGYNWRYLYTKTNSNYSVELSTNFEFNIEGVNNKVVLYHEFNTDVDITISPQKYVRLIPKGTGKFTSFIYTNNFFAFDYSTYDFVNKKYSTVQSGALNEMSFDALGGFNWLYWNVEFESVIMSLNPVISIFNPNENDLIIKIKSSDFDYKILDLNSNEFCVDGICYVNNYDDLYNLAHSFTYTGDFYDEDYEDGLSFIKELPKMVKDFTKSFAFIGTLFTTFFTIFTGSIANYFYVIFGLMIVMIIIKILK